MSQEEKPKGVEWSSTFDEAYAGKLENLSLLTAGMDRRQKGIFKKILVKYQATGNDWELMAPQMRSDIWKQYIDEEISTRPPYREQAMRLKKIRLDNKWSYAEFAEKLHSPKGEEPFPDEDFSFTEKKMADLEYGNSKIDQKIAALLYHKFQISGQWLLEGIGVPHTRTNTLDMSRIISIEERLDVMGNIILNNLGQPTIERLGKDGHASVVKNPDGNYGMKGAVNAILRLELSEAQSEIRYLKSEIGKQDTIIEDMKRRMEEFFEEFYGTPEDRENSYQLAINTLEEQMGRVFEYNDLELNPKSPREYLKQMEELQERMAKAKNDHEKMLAELTPEERETREAMIQDNLKRSQEIQEKNEKERKRKALKTTFEGTKPKTKSRRRAKPKSS